MWQSQPCLYMIDAKGAKSLWQWTGLISCIVAVHQIHEGIDNAFLEGWILQETPQAHKHAWRSLLSVNGRIQRRSSGQERLWNWTQNTSS